MGKLAKMARGLNPMPTGNILLLNEEPALAALHFRTFTKEGYSVLTTSNSDETLRRLKSGNVDVLLADISMSEKTALVFLRQVHAISPSVPVIVMVSELNNRFVVEAAELGAVQSLTKPVDQSLLRRTVSRVIRLKRVHQQNPVEAKAVHGRELVRMNATKVKNQLGQVLDKVMQGEIVLITRHESPKAAVIPMAEFEKLSRTAGERLTALSHKYDAMLARMQTPAARKKLKSAFDASPKQIAQAALALAQKRG
jgi:prevent-host-death family protein